MLHWVCDDSERRAALGRALKKRGTVRLNQYVDGIHYPTPKVLRRIADAIGESWLVLYADAGYQRELLLPMLRLSERQVEDEVQVLKSVCNGGIKMPAKWSWKDVAANFAVRRFPRRGEHLAAGVSYGLELLRIVVESPLRDEAEKRHLRGDSDRDALPPLLKYAYDILGDDDYHTTLRSEHAADFVREWAKEVSWEEVTRAEQFFYEPRPLEA